MVDMNIKKYLEHGTQEDLAEALGVKQSTISKLLRGKNDVRVVYAGPKRIIEKVVKTIEYPAVKPKQIRVRKRGKKK